MYVAKSSREEWTRITDRFLELWNVPSCAGVIGKKRYQNALPSLDWIYPLQLKEFPLFVLLQMLTNNFVDIDIYDRSCDGGVLKISSFNKLLIARGLNLPNHTDISDKIENLPFVSVGDEAYPFLRQI
jgi:hypothetical protein